MPVHLSYRYNRFRFEIKQGAQIRFDFCRVDRAAETSGKSVDFVNAIEDRMDSL